MGESNGRLHLLNNGRSPMKKGGDLITRAQVEAFVQEYTVKVVLPKMIEICEHYMRQVPELTATMLGDAFAANGLTFLPPSGDPGSTGRGAGSTAADAGQSGDAAVPEAP